MNRIVNPKVSIVIPVYNGGGYLSQAIDSALNQTYPNVEILVINDGSNDNGETDRISKSYGGQIVYHQKQNGGVASALNTSISLMSGDYFSWLSHDDLYCKDKVACQVEALTTSECEQTIIYSDYCVFSDDPENTVPVLLQGGAPDAFRYWLTVQNVLHGCTLLIPKTAFLLAGRFNEQLRTTQDYDLWFRMAKTHRFVHLPKQLVKARSHPDQGSRTMSEVVLEECNSMLSRFVAELSEDDLLHGSGCVPVVAYAKIASSMWSRGFFVAGRVAMRLSLAHFSAYSLKTSLAAIGIATRGLLMLLVMKPVRMLISPRFRLMIRRWLKEREVRVISSQASLSTLGLKEKFSEVYEKNVFQGSVSRSGAGSDLRQTAIVRRELPRLLEELGVRVLVDAPCGDWYWMREVHLPIEQYIGLDIVEALIAKNQTTYGGAKTLFKCMNLADGALPLSDLIFSRDCLVHLSFHDALNIISSFKSSGAKYLLTTTFTSRKVNQDLDEGFWRPLNMQLPPFNFPVPIRLINEGCTEGNNLFSDKCLGLWMLKDIELDSSR